MNERFEQMMLEATKDMPQGYYVPGEYFQKFAELIIRECTKLIEESTEDDEYWSRVTGAESIMAIEQHFGVEE